MDSAILQVLIGILVCEVIRVVLSIRSFIRGKKNDKR